MKLKIKNIFLLGASAVILLSLLNAAATFAQTTDLSKVSLTVSPTSYVMAGQTDVTFRVSGAPKGADICVVGTLNGGNCEFDPPPADGLFTQVEWTLEKPGNETYSVTVNNQIAPNAKASLTILAQGSSGTKKANGQSCTAATECTSGNCVSGTCTASGVTPDTGTGGGGGTTSGGSSQCGNDPNLKWDDSAKLCLPKAQSCTDGSLACQSSLTGLILKVIEYLLVFSGIIAVLFIIIGGFWYITAAGNEEQSEKGKKALMSAIIGIVVVSLAFLIVKVVSNTLNSGNILK